MSAISKRLRQSLGIQISTLLRIDNSLVRDLVLANALVVLAVSDALAVSAVLVALTALTASVVLVAHAAHAVPDAAAVAAAVETGKPVNSLVFYLKRTPALLQGSFIIR